jgi:hypothetical protein
VRDSGRRLASGSGLPQRIAEAARGLAHGHYDPLLVAGGGALALMGAAGLGS